MFYELRQYTIVPGKMDAWVRVMEEEILPFQVACGTSPVGARKTRRFSSGCAVSNRKPNASACMPRYTTGGRMKSDRR